MLPPDVRSGIRSRPPGTTGGVRRCGRTDRGCATPADCRRRSSGRRNDAPVAVAAKHVYKPLADAEHAVTTANFGPISRSLILPESWGRRHRLSFGTQILPSRGSNPMAETSIVSTSPEPAAEKVTKRLSPLGSNPWGVRLRGCAATARQTSRVGDSLRVSLDLFTWTKLGEAERSLAGRQGFEPR